VPGLLRPVAAKVCARAPAAKVCLRTLLWTRPRTLEVLGRRRTVSGGRPGGRHKPSRSVRERSEPRTEPTPPSETPSIRSARGLSGHPSSGAPRPAHHHCAMAWHPDPGVADLAGPDAVGLHKQEDPSGPPPTASRPPPPTRGRTSSGHVPEGGGLRSTTYHRVPFASEASQERNQRHLPRHRPYEVPVVFPDTHHPAHPDQRITTAPWSGTQTRPPGAGRGREQGAGREADGGTAVAIGRRPEGESGGQPPRGCGPGRT